MEYKKQLINNKHLKIIMNIIMNLSAVYLTYIHITLIL